MKRAPKNVKLCPQCGNKDQIGEIDFPKFQFKEKKKTTKQISIITKTPLNKKLKTLF